MLLSLGLAPLEEEKADNGLWGWGVEPNTTPAKNVIIFAYLFFFDALPLSAEIFYQ
jgi:hypothetical protein